VKSRHPTRHVAVRLDDTIMTRIDALIPSLSTPWHEATRSDALRSLVHLGLDKMKNGHETAPASRLRRSAR
jgi:hypothetical protein